MIVSREGLEEDYQRTAGVGLRRCFGLDATSLHDRYWASRRVLIVRRGERRPVVDGPALYLLIEPSDLVFFDPRLVARRLQQTRSHFARLRLRARSAREETPEIVESEAGGELRSIHRRYASLADRSTRAFMTSDARLAGAWSVRGSRLDAIQTLDVLLERAEKTSLVVDAQVYRNDDPDACDRALRRLVRTWSRVGSVIPDAFELRPGVWIHRTVYLHEDAQIVAPVWIGAGARLDQGESVIGPAIVPDQIEVPVPDGAIDWGMLRTPKWKLTPPLGRRAARRISKRAFDIVFSLCVLAATLPLYPFIMLAIMIEDGWPVFFAHTRQTMHGKPFPCLKFRTMCKDAERIKQEILRRNEVDGPQFFVKNDPRVLRVGRFLRRYQLDELPQFINVLLGHMSVVGPRPSPDKENQYCPTWREMRLGVRPGVTGLWQVKRTREPETDFQEWIRYDLEYVQHQSWRMDIWIILQTIKRMIGG